MNKYKTVTTDTENDETCLLGVVAFHTKCHCYSV